MRPTRRYYFEFTKDGYDPVKLFALGQTPCKARAEAWTMLERYLDASPELPRNSWRLAQQSDLGIAG